MRWVDSAASWLDAAVVGGLRLKGPSDERIEAMSAEERLEQLQQLQRDYGSDELLAFPGGFLQPGPIIEPRVLPVRTPHGLAWELSWPSAYEVWHPAMGERFSLSSRNATAWARCYPAGSAPGPTVIAIHGYGAGRRALSPLIWPILGWKRQGIDAVLPVLPFHGQRSDRVGPPIFPAPDPRFSQEGFRQLVRDLTALIAWLRSRGHGPIGLVGMSLGGYAAALLATLISELAYVVMVIPLSSLADVALSHGRLGTGPHARALHAAIEAVFRPTSPLSRPPRVEPDRVWVVAARADRVTGVAQAERLAQHFSASLAVVPGSHVLQFGLPWSQIVAYCAERSR